MKSYLMVAGVVAAALFLGACGDDTGGFSSGDGDDDDGGGSRSAEAIRPPADSAQSAPSSGGAPVAGGTGDTPLPGLESGRKIIFTASLALRAEDVGRSFSDALLLAKTNGGYVEKSQFANDGDDREKRSASLTIRVPSGNYEALLTSLRTLSGATVDTEGSNSKEVTEEYTDLQSRQRNLERTEQQYLSLLAAAKTIPDILTVQDRLSAVRSQIEQIQGRLKVLDDLTDFATVNVSIAPVIAKVEAPKSEDWKLSTVFVESWERSFEVARYVAAAGVVLFVAVAWLGIPALVVLFLARRVHRAHGAPAN